MAPAGSRCSPAESERARSAAPRRRGPSEHSPCGEFLVPGRRLALIVAVVALVVSVQLAKRAPRAAADELGEEIPAGKFDILAGLRQNVGGLGAQWGFGWVLGLGAGYQVVRSPGGTTSVGLAWSALWSHSGAESATTVEDPLKVFEMSFGVRVKRQLGELTPRYLFLSGGATLLRASVPIPPDGDRLYLGGYGGVGLEQYVLGRAFVGLEARYGLIGAGPSSLTLMLSVSPGT